MIKETLNNSETTLLVLYGKLKLNKKFQNVTITYFESMVYYCITK